MLFQTPHAFIDTAQLMARMKRLEGAEDDIEQRLLDAVNAATHWMERTTRRRLRARNYRTAVTISGSASNADATVTMATALARVGDDVIGVGIEPGSQVLSITDSGHLELTRNVTAAINNGSLTFGSMPLSIDVSRNLEAYSPYVRGQSEIWLPEHPLVTVFGLYSLDLDGNRTALDTTGARFDYATGRIILTHDIFTSGRLEIQAEVRAGYTPPTATDLGNDAWYSLEAIAFRAAEIYFMDALNIRGRVDSLNAGGASASFGAASMPADLISAITPFCRRW